MRVYKFGGASIKDAQHIKNLLQILQNEDRTELVLVVSAMGKTTNKLEQILSAFLQQQDYKSLLNNLADDFLQVAKELFAETSSIFAEITAKFAELEQQLLKNKKAEYNFIYDQVIPYGELITSHLVATYLQKEGIANTLLDARSYIHTDKTHRDANVNWELTSKNIQQISKKTDFFITQGFIAQATDGTTTTLGREGSDYSAAIFAYCLDAEALTVWKDVAGVLNADPRYFDQTVLLEQISFTEAIELAYYGASIIHPKTIQPLYNKNIPLRVRSFQNPQGKGTRIGNGESLIPNVPCYILKENQQLLQISSREFSFIMENDISAIFKILHETQMKVNLLHNSAISLVLCIDDRLGDIENCMEALQEKYNVTLKKNVTLQTIRNFDKKDFKKRFGAVKPLLRQRKNDVVHIILAPTYEN